MSAEAVNDVVDGLALVGPRCGRFGFLRTLSGGAFANLGNGPGIEFSEVSSSTQQALGSYVKKDEGGPKLLGRLISDPEHQAVLKFYQEHIGETIKLDKLAAEVGFPQAKLVTVLSDMALYDLAGFSGDNVRFKECKDDKLGEAIELWLSANEESDDAPETPPAKGAPPAVSPPAEGTPPASK